jgi:hypothetical protein
MRMSHRIDPPRDTLNSVTRRPAWRSLYVAGLALLLSTTGGFLAGCGSGDNKPKSSDAPKHASTDTELTSTLFLDKNNGEEYNASGVVPLGDSRFLFCDNNLNDALMELVVSKDGQQQGPLVRRPLVGLGKKHIDDMEELTIVEQDGRRLVFAVTSLSVKPGSKKKGEEEEVRPGGLLRITIQPDGFLATELMSDFRAWLTANAPEIASSAENDPELGGLNIEGLGWDARRGALLLGIRTPVPGGKPLIRPVRIKDLAGPWTTGNLEMLPPIHLAVENAIGEQGIRSISRNGFGEGFFVVVGNSTSESEAPFSVYTWDGGDEGKVSRLPISFHHKMKPEGITTGTIGGRKALLFVDDGGGFSVLWYDEIDFGSPGIP